jgi:hypothetical protein
MAAIFVGKHLDTVQLLSNRGALAEAVPYNAAVQAVFQGILEHILEEQSVWNPADMSVDALA